MFRHDHIITKKATVSGERACQPLSRSRLRTLDEGGFLADLWTGGDAADEDFPGGGVFGEGEGDPASSGFIGDDGRGPVGGGEVEIFMENEFSVKRSGFGGRGCFRDLGFSSGALPKGFCGIRSVCGRAVAVPAQPFADFRVREGDD